MKISVLILAASEEENLKLLIPQLIDILNSINETYEILIVDSAVPTDNTAQICSQYGCVRYMNQTLPRYAGAFRCGIEAAKGEFIVVLDADFSHDPKVIPAIFEKVNEGYDMVIGSRYCKGGVSNDKATSHAMSILLNSVMRAVIGVRAHDISTSYRIYRRDEIKNVNLTCKNYEVLQEVILRMKKNKKLEGKGKFTIGEVPITFNKRLYGESKRKLLQFIATYVQTIFKFLAIRFSKNA